MAKPLAPHGSYARFVGRPASNIPGCRCDECAEEGRRYVRRRDLLTATGRPLTVSAAPARWHIQYLLASGAGWNQLAAASNSSSATILAIVTGKQKKIRRSTASRFLRVRLADVLVTDRSESSLISVRKLRALSALGHSSPFIAEHTGLSRSLIAGLLQGRLDNIRPSSIEAIDSGFRELSMVAGRSACVATKAKAKGWAPPLAWDDIDDPAAEPVCATETADDGETVDEVALRRLAKGEDGITVPVAERPAAARWLAAQGIGPWTISRKLGANKQAVKRWLADGEKAA